MNYPLPTNSPPPQQIHMSAKAEQYKEQGNRLFASGDYKGAINMFSQAISTHATAVYYSNRATCYLKLANYRQALADSRQALSLDPNYVKGKQRCIEAMIRCNQLADAVKLADQLFMQDQTSKSRELNNEAKRANTLINDPQQSFTAQVNTAVNNLLILVAQAIKILVSSEFPMMSMEERQKNVKAADQYEMSLAGIVEQLSNLRDNLGEIGMKSLPDDHNFMTVAVPTYGCQAEVMATFNILMQNFRHIADAFTHYGLTGYTCDDENISKNHNYYINNASSYISQCRNGHVKLVLQACNQLLAQNLQGAQQTISKLAGQQPQFQEFIRQFQAYQQFKDKGSEQYKANNVQCAQNFKQATLQMFDYQTLSQKSAIDMDPLMSLVTLCAKYLAAQTLSNEGMAQHKQKHHGQALALLSAATFLDQTYEKAHRRAGTIYYDAKMYLEAEREYAFSSVLCKNDQELANSIKNCQRQARPYLRKDYYAILEVEKGIDPNSDEYNKKYKKICAKWHPDRYARDPTMRRFAQTKFRQIQEADSVLRDKTKKMIYDQGGDPVNEGAGGMSGTAVDFGEMMGGVGGIDLGQIFGMMGGGHRGARVRGFEGFPGNVQFTFHTSGNGGQQSGMPPGFGDIFSQFFQ